MFTEESTSLDSGTPEGQHDLNQITKLHSSLSSEADILNVRLCRVKRSSDLDETYSFLEI